MKKKYKLKKNIKKTIIKIAITLLFAVLDVIMYRNLMFLSALDVKTNWGSAIALTGWFWALAGQFIVLYFIWE